MTMTVHIDGSDTHVGVFVGKGKVTLGTTTVGFYRVPRIVSEDSIPSKLIPISDFDFTDGWVNFVIRDYIPGTEEATIGVKVGDVYEGSVSLDPAFDDLLMRPSGYWDPETGQWVYDDDTSDYENAIEWGDYGQPVDDSIAGLFANGMIYANNGSLTHQPFAILMYDFTSRIHRNVVGEVWRGDKLVATSYSDRAQHLSPNGTMIHGNNTTALIFTKFVWLEGNGPDGGEYKFVVHTSPHNGDPFTVEGAVTLSSSASFTVKPKPMFHDQNTRLNVYTEVTLR